MNMLYRSQKLTTWSCLTGTLSLLYLLSIPACPEFSTLSSAYAQEQTQEQTQTEQVPATPPVYAQEKAQEQTQVDQVPDDPAARAQEKTREQTHAAPHAQEKTQGQTQKDRPPAALIGSSAPPKARFHYQLDTGHCVDAQGHRGHNPIDIHYLFDGVDETQLKDPEYRPKFAYTDKNAECVDFSNFDFNRIIKLSYSRLKNWNLRGARLDDANFSFARMSNADFRGAQLQKISIGYTHLDGRIDRFTRYPKICRVQRATGESPSAGIKSIICNL